MNRWLVFFTVNMGRPGYPKHRAVVINFLDTPGSGPFGSEERIVTAIHEHVKDVPMDGYVTLTGMVKVEGDLPDVILNDEEVTADIGTFGLDTTL